MAYKISDATKAKLNACCKTCEATEAITAIAAGTTNITYLSSTGMTNTKAVTVTAE